MSKYGLQIRQPKKSPAPQKPPLRPPAFAFGGDDNDDVEREISRQGSKNKALRKIEEQHQKALEEDPSVFDYDGVYDEMKEKIAMPRLQDRAERAPKYIQNLIAATERRKQEDEIVYERKILKERSKDDHLHGDKEKFVTRAYKEKLREREKWLEEERRRKILEEKDDVTKKRDLSDFYFGLSKNVAFGAGIGENAKPGKDGQSDDNDREQKTTTDQPKTEISPEGRKDANDQPEISRPDTVLMSEHNVKEGTSAQENTEKERAPSIQNSSERFNRSEDALSAARERFLARKRAKIQE